MKIIVLNCGSSSIKYQLFNMPSAKVLAKGLVDKIGLKGSSITHQKDGGSKVKFEGEILDHQAGIEYLLGILSSKKHGSVKDLKEIDAVGHRVVHGSEDFKKSVLLTDKVIQVIQQSTDLAPLHNPPNLKGIEAMQLLLPHASQVGVFDTAFHQTMPRHAYLYGLPYSLYQKYKIRRYGFHGTSHKYVSNRACKILNADIKKLKIITCHLGNGASMTAIKNGKSIDTSMGMTPLEGLIMGTRSGDLDAGALVHIAKKEKINAQAVNTLLNKHSGILGISGVSQDMRDVEKAADEGHHRAITALEMYHYRIKKYIGAYAAALGGLDMIVFTGGVGENGPESREAILDDMKFLGIEIDRKKNAGLRSKEAIISKVESKVKVLVVPTNEELMIAKDTYHLSLKSKKQHTNK